MGQAVERGAVALAATRELFDAVLASLREGVVVFGPGGERLWDPLVSAPGALAERVAELPQPPLAAGSGAVRFHRQLASQGVEIPDDADPVHRVAARHICALGAAGANGVDAGPPTPIYMRPPDAERWRERDTLKRPD